MKTIKNASFLHRCKYIIPLMIGISVVSNCTDFLEHETPKNMIAQSSVFTDRNMALSALADVYSNLRNNSMLRGDTSGMHFLLGCYADELIPLTSQEKDFKIFYQSAVQPSTKSVDDLWINAYKQIYAVNNILEGVNVSLEYLDEPTVKQLKGEALAIRAYLHFQTTLLYGDIPYVTSTDYRINQVISKSTHQTVMQNIIRDLHDSESLLNYSYPTPSKGHLNKAAVELLLSRAYLYEKDWQHAREYASKVITNPSYSLETDLLKVFLKDNKSSIWYFVPAEAGMNTLEGQYFIIPSLPAQNAALSSSFMSSFESSDLRRQQWTKSVANNQETYYFPFKYKQNQKTATSVEYSIMLRTEEAYLTMAEAENELGFGNTALLHLNKIRNRAGLSSLANMPKEQLRTAILEERRHEFFTEGGYRFIDLKRTGYLNAVMTNIKPTWKSHMDLLPLPERELLANPNIKPQNNGY